MFVYCIVYSILCILQELSKRLALFVRIRLWWKDGTGSKVLPTNQHRRHHSCRHLRHSCRHLRCLFCSQCGHLHSTLHGTCIIWTSKRAYSLVTWLYGSEGPDETERKICNIWLGILSMVGAFLLAENVITTTIQSIWGTIHHKAHYTEPGITSTSYNLLAIRALRPAVH